jgi:hypothetical protein
MGEKRLGVGNKGWRKRWGVRNQGWKKKMGSEETRDGRKRWGVRNPGWKKKMEGKTPGVGEKMAGKKPGMGEKKFPSSDEEGTGFFSQFTGGKKTRGGGNLAISEGMSELGGIPQSPRHSFPPPLVIKNTAWFFITCPLLV